MDDLIARLRMICDHVAIAARHAESLERDIELHAGARRTGAQDEVRHALKLLRRAVGTFQNAAPMMEGAAPVALPVAAE